MITIHILQLKQYSSDNWDDHLYFTSLSALNTWLDKQETDDLVGKVKVYGGWYKYHITNTDAYDVNDVKRNHVM